MDLELSDEQRWLSESVETLLTRKWVGAEHAHTAGADERAQLWAALTEFGALEELGAVELCLIGRSLGAHLASAPFLASAALRYAGAEVSEATALALLEPGGTWALDAPATELAGSTVNGTKVAVEHADADQIVVLASAAGTPTLALVARGAVAIAPQRAFDVSVPISEVAFSDTPAEAIDASVDRLAAIAGLLAAAESVGAAERLLTLARDYAAERRQFGRTIGSYQALRHVLADMYTRRVSAWSTVLYAAAALDEDLDGALQTASIAKAYVARAAREVAHGAFQVFGGIAFTEEHVAHRYLRRIVVREQQFGDAAHHERRLGRSLAEAATAGAVR
jgi:alkylation response protein AidB-like acyl-CoA dehydrogenase